MGIQPVVFCRPQARFFGEKETGIDKPWIPDMGRVPVEYYKRSHQLTYLLPTVYDGIGLKRIFEKYSCEFVHAHNLETAFYSYHLGLPTLFDDWEYYYEYLDFPWPFDISNIGMKGIARVLLSRYFKRNRAKKIVRDLIRKIPVIVTNEEVERRYREFGASSIWWVPNVPLSYEREYAFAVSVQKRDRLTTCYIGSVSSDENSRLRNTSGIRELWEKNDIGELYVFEGKNYIPHLDVLRKVRECHFNLLYWQPLPVHRYYLQNKAFLASVVGVPTIISSSLTSTIKLLGEYALSVRSLEEIPKIIKNYDHSRNYRLNPAHIWEHYQPKIKEAYKAALELG